MPRINTYTARSLAPLAAVALSASACATIEPLETTGVHEVFTGTSSGVWCEGDAEASLLEAGADLKGPHFAASFLCHYSETAVPDHVTELSEQLAGLPTLVDGAELLINQMAFEPAHTPETDGVGGTAWVQVGDERIDLEVLPSIGSFVAVSVPDGEDAVLWIEDEGRAQGLDFRTGERVDAIEGYYNGTTTGTVEIGGYAYEEISVLNGSDAYKLSCSREWNEATRSLWSATRGWAPDGKAFVEVEFTWCGPFEDIVQWHLDQEAAVSVRDGGELTAPTSWEASEPLGEDGRITITVLFEVPDDMAELTVAFTPVGDLENLSGGQDYAFAETPETTEWAVSF